jgi:general secretion pathway protein G
MRSEFAWDRVRPVGFRPANPGRVRRVPRRVRRRRPAFSLIEFTVVLALIGLLAGVVTVSVRHTLVKGRQNAVRGQIADLKQGVEAFYIATTRYPTSDEGMAVLTKGTEGHPEPILPRLPKDPWGRDYVYLQPGRTEPYEILCLGADGREGGTGDDLDISSANLSQTPGK